MAEDEDGEERDEEEKGDAAKGGAEVRLSSKMLK